MELKEKKEKLFAEIADEMAEHCDICQFNPNYGLDCELTNCTFADDFKTAILSLDKKENWPNLFEN